LRKTHIMATSSANAPRLRSVQLGWTHLSAGDLLRAERTAGGDNAKLIEEFIEAGKIVPVEITVGLIKKAMTKILNETGKNNFLVDGFPRSLENWSGWQTVYGAEAVMPHMLFFECPLEVLEKRILGRAQYSGRSDDNVESLRKRFTTYKDETMPIVDVFRAATKCTELDSSTPREEVWASVKNALAPWTEATRNESALSERSEMLLGLRPYPKKMKTVT